MCCLVPEMFSFSILVPTCTWYICTAIPEYPENECNTLSHNAFCFLYNVWNFFHQMQQVSDYSVAEKDVLCTSPHCVITGKWWRFMVEYISLKSIFVHVSRLAVSCTLRQSVLKIMPIENNTGHNALYMSILFLCIQFTYINVILSLTRTDPIFCQWQKVKRLPCDVIYSSLQVVNTYICHLSLAKSIAERTLPAILIFMTVLAVRHNVDNFPAK